MADFSRYGGVAPEWEELTKTTTIPEAGPGLDQSVEDYQKATNASREAASNQQLQSTGLQDKVLYQDFAIPTRDSSNIPARLYRNKAADDEAKLPILLYFHGGGFLFGTLSTEDAACSRLACSQSILVLNVCYRHAPQHRHPTQQHDAQDAYSWLLSNIDEIGGDSSQIIVGGISAGASLASSITLRQHTSSYDTKDEARPDPRIKGLLLGIPWLYHLASFPLHEFASREVSAYYENRLAPILPQTQVQLFADQLGAEDPDDTSLFVGNVDEEALKGWPKTAFLVAGRDPLRDDGMLFEDKLRRNDVETKLHVFAGLPHGFFRYPSLPSTETWQKEMDESIRWMLADR